MKWLKFLGGWILWHLRAGFWYLGLVFRLWFAIGLDRDFDHKDENIDRHFRCPIPRDYRRHLQRA